MPRLRLMSIMMACTIALIAVSGCSRATQTSVTPNRVAAANTPAFDDTRAFDLLKKQVEIGPRYPGAPGHKTTAEFIVSHLELYADSIRLQDFTRQIGGKTLHMRNIIAAFNSKANRWVLLAAHWDTRPTADMEVVAKNRSRPIPGANDGASGVAVLLELARMFSKSKPNVGVLMVFFDGEDYGSTNETMFLGSRYFADNLVSSTSIDGRRLDVKYGILLDMVGDKDLLIPQEARSFEAAPDVVRKVWNAAEKLGYGDVFVPRIGHSISDDHIPLIEAGLKCIDVIDFDYAPWHTLDDTVDKCSPRSLRVVGNTVARVVYEENGQ